VSISERADSPADAAVSGTEQQWIAALGPDGTTSGLEVSGDRDLAEELLGIFAGAATASPGRSAQRAVA
jgi:hypothetical protein